MEFFVNRDTGIVYRRTAEGDFMLSATKGWVPDIAKRIVARQVGDDSLDPVKPEEIKAVITEFYPEMSDQRINILLR